MFSTRRSILLFYRNHSNGWKNDYFILANKLSYSRSIYFADNIDPTEKTFGKICIANRGEIACRIIRTCKAMGIKTVAIYSEVDSSSVHVQQADEAYCIGQAPARHSYLNLQAILEVVRISGAEALHPGYGFLSENALFAKQLSDMGVVFIGPNCNSIRLMGDKIESKRIANRAGLLTIAGFDGPVLDGEHCVHLAQQIGYPVMVKASAGGGGKGMRVAFNHKEALQAFELSKHEALACFDDDRLLIEKYIESPRHIEVQVVCDKHGNAIYLNERECSIQRRNQKVIEEAPSTSLHHQLRAAMGEQAVALARQVRYDSADTVEFLLDKSGHFHFLEMNTRLQVEHSVTEFTSGIDIVHQMIRVASGHALKHRQKDVQLRGWAIEARVCAEDPYMNFGLPSVGRLTRYRKPTLLESVRCDSGVQEGSQISIYYDPLICKLTTYGSNREQAIDSMKVALDNYVIRGLTHNISLLRDILMEPNFVQGKLSTSYLSEVYAFGFKGRQLSKQSVHTFVAIVSAIYLRYHTRSGNFVNSRSGRLNDWYKTTSYHLLVDLSENRNLNITEMITSKVCLEDNKYNVMVNDLQVQLPCNISLADMTLDFQVNHQTLTVQLISMQADGRLQLQFEGTIFAARVIEQRIAKYLECVPDRPKTYPTKVIKSPLPGLVRSVCCQVGDQVHEGQELCVIEAMKMQNSLIATSTGKVASISCKVGDIVEHSQVLVRLQ